MFIKKIYLDSNVFISLVRQEIDGSFRMLFTETELFLQKCKKHGITMVLSAILFKEVEKIIGLKREDVLDYFNQLELKIEIIEFDKNLPKLAKKIEKQYFIHLADSMHVYVAKDSNCDLIITWNQKDFKKTEKLIGCKTPAEFNDLTL